MSAAFPVVFVNSRVFHDENIFLRCVMKLFKTLGASAIAVGITLALLTTASFAWFTASQNARAEGLELTATVPNNLQISTDNQTWGETAELKSSVTEMIPASSVQGADGTFYYIDAVEGVGGALSDGDDFQATAVTSSTIGGSAYYIDIPVYLRLSDSTVGETLQISSVTVTATNSGAGTLADAYRVAVFHANSEESLNKQIFFGGNPFDSSTGEAAYSVLPLTGTTTMAETPSTGINYSFDVDGMNAAQLTVRIWLEGQDGNCKDANAQDTVKVSIAFGD